MPHDTSPERQILAFVMFTDASNLHILLNPAWETIVRLEEHDYFSELWNDFVLRAKADCEALFKQLTALAVGSLVASTVGRRLSDYPELQVLARDFVDISDSEVDHSQWCHHGSHSVAY